MGQAGLLHLDMAEQVEKIVHPSSVSVMGDGMVWGVVTKRRGTC